MMKYAAKVLRPQLFVALVFVGLLFGGMGLRWSHDPARALAKKAPVPQVLSYAAPAEVDCTQTPCMALTFDDGPSPSYTPALLDVLARYNVRATFFVMGKRIAGNEGLLKRMHQDGHEIGNHTWDHPDLTLLSPEQVEAQVVSTQAAVAGAGVPVPTLFRPPYGEYNQMVLAHIPMSVIRWDVDPSDWRPSFQPYIAAHVVAHAHPGAIVIMHDTEAATLLAVEPIIQQLQAAGYQLVTVSDLLDMPSNQRGVYFHRQE